MSPGIQPMSFPTFGAQSFSGAMHQQIPMGQQPAQQMGLRMASPLGPSNIPSIPQAMPSPSRISIAGMNAPRMEMRPFNAPAFFAQSMQSPGIPSAGMNPIMSPPMGFQVPSPFTPFKRSPLSVPQGIQSPGLNIAGMNSPALPVPMRMPMGNIARVFQTGRRPAMRIVQNRYQGSPFRAFNMMHSPKMMPLMPMPTANMVQQQSGVSQINFPSMPMPPANMVQQPSRVPQIHMPPMPPTNTIQQPSGVSQINMPRMKMMLNPASLSQINTGMPRIGMMQQSPRGMHLPIPTMPQQAISHRQLFSGIQSPANLPMMNIGQQQFNNIRNSASSAMQMPTMQFPNGNVLQKSIPGAPIQQCKLTFTLDSDLNDHFGCELKHHVHCSSIKVVNFL